ncbi:ABC transporter substrate-binding protein [Haematobacter missouriensis]|uniref:ABC transporter substrate-binding protein n=1 Tax=Haematobacter missouriensis TaxID=366616 RepID=A0A212ANH6_9RHOB|nr:ABC transporter substrate-binding protein [Haematobacter missouriensis]KFI25079.1 ABC transporter substrate-binding protein [Haematobacter missouriensis]OWJ73853.1 ABC transporter substrate-binding protein [Haematobacter missouriensis]OWJ83064.1 ABC transporter substrate-binding protein [Haematobacter missouriensis]
MFPSLLRGAALIAATALFPLLPAHAAAPAVDLSPEQPDRIRTDRVEAAIAALPAGFRFVSPGKLTVASVPGRLPFAVYATDTSTPVGGEPDVAQLVADSLGLELELIPVAWADWPLGLASRKYDAVIHNVTVTEERKEKFDFATYRTDLLGWYVAAASPITRIDKAADIAGLKVSVSSGTNQEQILLRWIEENRAQGLPTTEVLYFDDQPVLDLALQSGRIDAYLGPNATSAFQAAQEGKTRAVGTLSGGWPVTAEIAVAVKKGSGLASAVATALNAQIANGTYARTLARWNLSAEAITESRVNPPGLPKK